MNGGRMLAALLGLGLAAAACGDDVFEPGADDREFLLVEVEQEPVPATVATATIGEATCTLELVEGRLLLRPGSRFELNTQGREVCVSGGSSDSNDDSNTVTGRYEVSGSTLLLFSDTAFQIADHTFALGPASVSATTASIQATRTEQPYAGSLVLRFAARR